EANKQLDLYVAEVENGMIAEGKMMTFAKFTEMWAKDYGTKELAPKTYARYKGMLDSRILPYFGNYKITEIKPTHIINFYDFLSSEHQIKRCKGNAGARIQKPLSSKTILEHHRLIRAMLQKAVYWQLIVSNPMARIQAPKSKKPKINYYDEDECKQLFVALENEKIKYQTIVLLTLFTGTRRGEVVGMDWTDIDFNNQFINIDKSNQYLPDRGIYTKDPKTESGIRGIAIPKFVIETLKHYKTWYEEQKELYGDLWFDSNKLFVQKDGKPMQPDTVTRWFKRFIEKNNLPPITFHGLRHTNATLLISQNIDIAVISSRLGHAQITTTLNFYVHPVKSHNKLAGEVLEKLLLSKN
ncbi:MAG: site-specific integrase, partial [Clostridia bacterium]